MRDVFILPRINRLYKEFRVARANHLKTQELDVHPKMHGGTSRLILERSAHSLQEANHHRLAYEFYKMAVVLPIFHGALASTFYRDI